MPIPGSSFLATVKQKLRKAPPAVDSQNGERPLPQIPTNNGPGPSHGTEPIALATPSPSKNPRGLHEIISPFIDSVDREPGQPDPNPPEQEADHPDSPAGPSDQTAVPTPSGNGLAAPGEGPATPETAGKGEGAVEVSVEVSIEASIEESSPDLENGKMELREMFARKSVSNPTIKALLERHHAVNTRALSQELREFAFQLNCPKSPDAA